LNKSKKEKKKRGLRFAFHPLYYYLMKEEFYLAVS